MFTRDELLAFLVDDLGADPDGLHDDVPLFSEGRLDSFRLVELMVFIEERGSFRMNPMDVNLDNLDTVGRILTYVGSRSA